MSEFLQGIFSIGSVLAFLAGAYALLLTASALEFGAITNQTMTRGVLGVGCLLAALCLLMGKRLLRKP